MRVEELIEILGQFDPALHVTIVTPDGDTIEIEDVEQEGPYVMIEVEG